MIEAGETLGVSFLFPTNDRASMRARIIKAPNGIGLVTYKEQRMTKYSPSDEVPTLGYFGTVAKVKPTLEKDFLALGFKNIL
jgi:hypothetical protein